MDLAEHSHDVGSAVRVSAASGVVGGVLGAGLEVDVPGPDALEQRSSPILSSPPLPTTRFCGAKRTSTASPSRFSTPWGRTPPSCAPPKWMSRARMPLSRASTAPFMVKKSIPFPVPPHHPGHRRGVRGGGVRGGAGGRHPQGGQGTAERGLPLVSTKGWMTLA